MTIIVLLELYYQNVRGLNGKAHLMLKLLSLLVYDVICFTETWLKDDFYDGELFSPDQYDVHRSDRNQLFTSKSKGGGVLIATKNISTQQDFTVLRHPI